MQDITAKTKSQQIKGKKDQVSKIVYTEEGNGKVSLHIYTLMYILYTGVQHPIGNIVWKLVKNQNFDECIITTL